MRLLLFLLTVTLAIVAAPVAQGDPLAGDRAPVQAAFAAAARGELDLADAARFARHPLGGWLEVLAHEQQLDRLDLERLQAILGRLGDTPASRRLREAWGREAAVNGRWEELLALHQGGGNAEWQCLGLQAQHATGRLQDHWSREVARLWLRAENQGPACDALFQRWAADGDLTPALRWQRIELAARAGNATLVRAIARRLPAPEAAQAQAYAAFLEAPAATASDWPRNGLSRAVAEAGLLRLARRDADAAERLLGTLAGLLPAGSPEQGQVRAAIALWTAAAYRPSAAGRLAAVPVSAFNDELHGWAVREALARSDFAAALRAIKAMPSALREQPRWQYFEARLREDLGDPAAALPLFARAATSPTFHGFLAADRIGAPYALCPREPSSDPALRSAVRRQPALIRAFELFRIGEPRLAALEWQQALVGMDDARRLLAVEAALEVRWHDRAIFGMPSHPQAMQYYRLRFPLRHARILRREADRHELPASLLAALVRAESAFMPMARSSADARGLMQLLPSTAEAVAQRNRLPWNGAESLFRPETNLVLGSAYLAQRIADHQQRVYRALAAYNAGQGAVRRWIEARPQLAADYWIETIPFRETRDYVPRVLAFSVIYDWRLDGASRSLTDRLGGVTAAAPRPIACPALP